MVTSAWSSSNKWVFWKVPSAWSLLIAGSTEKKRKRKDEEGDDDDDDQSGKQPCKKLTSKEVSVLSCSTTEQGNKLAFLSLVVSLKSLLSVKSFENLGMDRRGMKTEFCYEYSVTASVTPLSLTWLCTPGCILNLSVKTEVELTLLRVGGGFCIESVHFVWNYFFDLTRVECWVNTIGELQTPRLWMLGVC